MEKQTLSTDQEEKKDFLLEVIESEMFSTRPAMVNSTQKRPRKDLSLTRMITRYVKHATIKKDKENENVYNVYCCGYPCYKVVLNKDGVTFIDLKAGDWNPDFDQSEDVHYSMPYNKRWTLEKVVWALTQETE